MYGLLVGLWRLWFSKVQYHLLLLGLDDAGKTTLLESLRHHYLGTTPPLSLQIPPTVGLNIGKIEIDSKKLLIWDLGGQSSLRGIWDKYFNEAHAILYVIDSTTSARLRETSIELDKLMKEPELQDVPILILCNKIDAVGAMPMEEIQQVIWREEWGNTTRSRNRPVHLQPISALTGQGITKGIEWLLTVIPQSARTKQLAENRLPGGRND